MDDLSIGVSALANKLERDPSYLSHIRSGSINPPINKFWFMLQAMEALKPGAIKHFGMLLAKTDHDDELMASLIRGLEPDELALLISDEQLAGLLYLAGKRIIERGSQKDSFSDEKLNTDLGGKLNIDSDVVIIG